MNTSLRTSLLPQRRITLAGALLLACASLGSAPASSAVPAPAPTPTSPRQQVEVRRGDTLDRVIRRTLPDLGLNPAFVRAAFVELNPQAFVRGRPDQLRAGTQLTVPGREDLRQRALSHYPALGELMQAQEPASAKADRSEEIRLRWIRYP